jgi:hypothetical protein
MSTNTVKYPDVKVRLTGTDGNAYAIMGKVQSALRRAGATDEEVAQYIEESQSGDYNHLLRTAAEWVEVS